MKRTIIAVLVAGGSVACAERSDFTAPALDPPQALMASVATLHAVEDAIDRIAPSLGESEAARDAATALRLLHRQVAGHDANGARGTSQALSTALARVERDQPELAPELDAIRLAVTQQ